MITEMKHFIILLIISMFPSELIQSPKENGCLCKHQTVTGGDDCGFFACLSEIKISFIARRSSENREILTNYDEKKSETYRDNEQKQVPCFIDTSLRTVDWISHFKWNLLRLLAGMIQKDISWTELLPFQIYSNDIFIPALTYYVYTLEEITI